MRVYNNPYLKGNPYLEDDTALEEAKSDIKENKGEETMKDTEEGINKDKRKCLISKEVSLLFITQLQHELANHNLYKTFASYYNECGLQKLVKYWEGRAAEEYIHHQWIFNYLNQCNVYFEYPEIPNIKIKFNDKITPFKATVDREIETTGGINNIMNQAMKEGDYLTMSFLLGSGTVEGKLIPEQSEEQKLSMDALALAEEGEDWLAIQDSIYDLYFNK